MPPSPSNSNSTPYSTRWRTWSDPHDAYSTIITPITTLIASALIQLSNSHLPLSSPDATALDLGTGTGALACLLCERFPELPVTATDISPVMVGRLRERVKAAFREGVEGPGDGEEREGDRKVEKGGMGKRLARTGEMDMRGPFVMRVIDGGGDGEGGGGEERQDGNELNSTSTYKLQEGTFSHIFCSVAIQSIPASEAESTMRSWRRLLRPGGILAISVWEQEESKMGPILLWGQGARKVRPGYMNPLTFEKGEWEGQEDLVGAMERVGFMDVEGKEVDVGYGVGTEKFLEWWWRSGHPMPAKRVGDFEGEEREEIRREMRRLLDEEYARGLEIPLEVGVAVGRK